MCRNGSLKQFYYLLFDVQELLLAKRKATAEIERLQERLDPKWLSSAFLDSPRALANHTCVLKKVRLVLCRGTAGFLICNSIQHSSAATNHSASLYLLISLEELIGPTESQRKASGHG